MSDPLRWDMELAARADEGDLWCIARWAWSNETDLFLCGILEVANPSESRPNLGFDGRDGYGLLALFADQACAVECIKKLGTNSGDGSVARDHPLPLSAVRFDVYSYDRSMVALATELGYFAALSVLARARIIHGSNARYVRLRLAESTRVKWTLKDLREAMGSLVPELLLPEPGGRMHTDENV